jgi:hypothetical protein
LVKDWILLNLHVVEVEILQLLVVKLLEEERRLFEEDAGEKTGEVF